MRPADWRGFVTLQFGRDRLRARLTLFGLAWGMAAFVLVNALGHGFEHAQRETVAGLGSSLLIVSGGTTSRLARATLGRRVEIDLVDAALLRQASSSGVLAVGAERVDDARDVAGPAVALRRSVRGIDEPYQVLHAMSVRPPGRLLSVRDVAEGRRVCLLGSALADALFQGRPALGERVRLGGVPHLVVGELLPQEGASFFGADNERVFVPLSVLRRAGPEASRLDVLWVQTDPPRHAVAEAAVRCLLARRHGFDVGDEDALEVYDTLAAARSIEAVGRGFQRFFMGVTLATLLVAAVGVVNIMLVSISQRTWEIGLRRAVGATRGDVRVQFMLETLGLVLAGGGLGVVAGLIIVALVALLPLPADVVPPPVLRRADAFGGLAVLSLLGLAAGVYPAFSATRVTPCEALRAT